MPARERVRLACESAGLDGIMSYEDIEEMTRPDPVVVDDEEEELPPPPPKPKAPKAPQPPARAPVPAKLPIAKGSKARALSFHSNRGGGVASSSAAAPSVEFLAVCCARARSTFDRMPRRADGEGGSSP